MPTDVQQAPSPIDVHVGSRLRMRRMMLDWSQSKLADVELPPFNRTQGYCD